MIIIKYIVSYFCDVICDTYVISEVKRVVAGVGEDFEEVVELSEHRKCHFTKHRFLHSSVLDLLNCLQVLRHRKQFLKRTKILNGNAKGYAEIVKQTVCFLKRFCRVNLAFEDMLCVLLNRCPKKTVFWGTGFHRVLG